jgi:hypothetical protein
LRVIFEAPEIGEEEKTREVYRKTGSTAGSARTTAAISWARCVTVRAGPQITPAGEALLAGSRGEAATILIRAIKGGAALRTTAAVVAITAEAHSRHQTDKRRQATDDGGHSVAQLFRHS